MKHLIYLLFLLTLISCVSDKESKKDEKDYTLNNDTTFSWFYRTSPLVKNNFRTFLDQIDTIAASQKQDFVLNFLSKQDIIPLIESDTIVHFLFWGEADSVAVAGDATGWAPIQKMKNISGTELWYATETYPSATRFEYKIVRNGKAWGLDSLNKQKVMGGMGENSELILPDYTKPLYIADIDSVEKGNYFDKHIHSNYLNEDRRMRIYLPYGYHNSNKKFPVIMFHDGIQFFDMTSSFNIFNNLIYQNKIQAFIAVFIEPVQRDEEYSGELQENYTNFVVEELLPFLDSNFRTIPTAKNRAQIGISNGGNIALWLVASHPESFHKVAALSSNVEKKIFEEFDKIPATDLKIYLLLGKYDIPVISQRVNSLNIELTKNDYDFVFYEYPEGHNWAFGKNICPMHWNIYFHLKRIKKLVANHSFIIIFFLNKK